jgi:hypothetical protein
MRFEDIEELKINGQVALEAKLNGSVVWGGGGSEPTPFFIGLQSNGGGSLPASGNRVWASRWQCPSDGTVLSMTYVVKASPSGHVKFLIFADSSGSPGALLAHSAGVSSVTGNTTDTISLAVTAGTWYWLGFVNDGASFPDVFSGPTGLPTANKLALFEGYNYSTTPSTLPSPSATYDSASAEIWADCETS